MQDMLQVHLLQAGYAVHLVSAGGRQLLQLLDEVIRQQLQSRHTILFLLLSNLICFHHLHVHVLVEVCNKCIYVVYLLTNRTIEMHCLLDVWLLGLLLWHLLLSVLHSLLVHELYNLFKFIDCHNMIGINCLIYLNDHLS